MLKRLDARIDTDYLAETTVQKYNRSYSEVRELDPPPILSEKESNSGILIFERF